MTREDIRTAIAVGFLAVVTAGGFYFDAVKHSPLDQSKPRGEQRNKTSDQSNVARQPMQSIHGQQSPDERRNASKDEPWQWNLAILTQWIFGSITTVLALLVYGVYEKQREIMAEMRGAAEQQTRILLRITRPLCVLDEITLESFSGAVPDINLPAGFRLMSIYGTIKNKGAAVAFAREMQMASCVAPEIGAPLTPETEATIFFGFNELKQGDVYVSPFSLYSVPVNDEFEKGELPLFVWGWLRYADIHGITRRSGFAFMWVRGLGNPMEGSFVTCGPASYWYDIEEEAKE